MKITLFYAPIACSLVPLISLYESGADFEVKSVNMRKQEQLSPEYLKLNPKHKVPTLLIDGRPLTENVAMALWMTRAFPHAGILPSDPDDEVRAVSIMAWCASGIHPHLTPNARPANYCDLPGSEESVKRVANVMLFEDLRIADEMLAGREWFFDHFTAADAYFYWCFMRAISFKLDLSEFKNCHSHYQRMLARPSVQKLVEHQQKVMAAFASAA